MDDLISREEAIDALNEYFARIEKLKRRGLTKGEKAISIDTVGTIETLPSAQPEYPLLKIIQDFKEATGCKDILVVQKDAMKAWDENGATYTMQPERKTGKWIDEGFYADGHGAHAFRCSECGGHIIEYDKDPFCRWCGADMRGVKDE